MSHRRVAFGRDHSAGIAAAEFAVVAAAHVAVAELGLERRRDLEIRSHLESTLIGRTRRRDLERLRETRSMNVEIPAFLLIVRPGVQEG